MTETVKTSDVYKVGSMRSLELHSDFTREQVHSIFDPDTKFTPQRGSWGLHGIVPIRDRPGDLVFFVTFGQRQGEHAFDESISSDGVLRWQSQPRQALSDESIRELIRHDENTNSIYLFLRTTGRVDGKPRPYTYLGKLKYLTHDSDRERPVYFAWQLLDWPIPDSTLSRMQISLEGRFTAARASAVSEEARSHPAEASGLIEGNPPVQLPSDDGPGKTTFVFRKTRASHAERDEANKKLGHQGELAVIEFEKRKLNDAGLGELAEKVRHVAQIEGDGAGYDVRSFDHNRSEIYIEVKTTTGPITTDFFITANEVAFSRAHAAQYELRRLYDFDMDTASGRFFSLRGDVSRLDLRATNYRISRLSTPRDA